MLRDYVSVPQSNDARRFQTKSSTAGSRRVMSNSAPLPRNAFGAYIKVRLQHQTPSTNNDEFIDTNGKCMQLKH